MNLAPISATIPHMFSAAVSVLLLGMVSLPLEHQEDLLSRVSVAPPSPSLEISQHLSASGMLIVDAHSGQEVVGIAPSFTRPMASLTKLMTALIIAENYAMDELVTIPDWEDRVEGNVAYLPSGGVFTVGEVLSALLIASGNDAAKALAVHHSGSEKAFVAEMNERATILGLRDTAFANASGMDAVGQHASPRDLSWLAMHVMAHPEIRERMGKRGERIATENGTVVNLSHTHALLHANANVIAGKTGTTLRAKQCLISLVESGGRDYLVVLMNSLQRYQDMRTILSALEEIQPPERIATLPRISEARRLTHRSN